MMPLGWCHGTKARLTASHADILLAHQVISSPQRDEPKECLRGRLGLLWRYFYGGIQGVEFITSK